jgi:Mor family transcriptional regulator
LNYKEKDLNKNIINLENFYISSKPNLVSNEIKYQVFNQLDTLENFNEITKKQKLNELYKYTLKILFSNLF